MHLWIHMRTNPLLCVHCCLGSNLVHPRLQSICFTDIYVVVMDDVETLGTYGQYIIDGYAQGLVECTTMTSQYVVGGVEYKMMCAQPPA